MYNRSEIIFRPFMDISLPGCPGYISSTRFYATVTNLSIDGRDRLILALVAAAIVSEAGLSEQPSMVV